MGRTSITSNRARWGLVAALLMCSGTDARADELWNYIRLTCASDMELFSVETFDLYNLSPADRGAYEETFGIFTIGSAAIDGWICPLQFGTYQVRRVHYHTGGGSGQCGADSWASFEVLKDDAVIYSFEAGRDCSNGSVQTTARATPYEFQACQTVFPYLPGIISRDGGDQPAIHCMMMTYD